MKKWVPLAAGAYALYALAPTWHTKYINKHALRQADGGIEIAVEAATGGAENGGSPQKQA